jgi:glycine cleavage system regulatory protein
MTLVILLNCVANGGQRVERLLLSLGAHWDLNDLLARSAPKEFHQAAKRRAARVRVRVKA